MSKFNSNNKKDIYKDDDAIEAKEKFIKRIIQTNAMASSDIKNYNFDIEHAKQKSTHALIAMGATEGLQSMLAAQILSIHELQQKTITYATACNNLELKKYYTNSAVKLSNCFTQQANALARLQGLGGQKIIVERVDVYQGGQAVVGDINTGKQYK